MTNPDRPRPDQSDGISAGAMAFIAFAMLFFLGVMFWSFTKGIETDKQRDVPRVVAPSNIK